MSKMTNLHRIVLGDTEYIYDSIDETFEIVSQATIKDLEKITKIDFIDKKSEYEKYKSKCKLLGTKPLEILIRDNAYFYSDIKTELFNLSLKDGVTKIPIWIDSLATPIDLKSEGYTKLVIKQPISHLQIGGGISSVTLDLSDINFSSCSNLYVCVVCKKLILSKSIERVGTLTRMFSNTDIGEIDWGDTYIDREMNLMGIFNKSNIPKNFSLDFINTEKITSLDSAFSYASANSLVIRNKVFNTCSLQSMFASANIKNLTISGCQFHNKNTVHLPMFLMFDRSMVENIIMSNTEVYFYGAKCSTAFQGVNSKRVVMPRFIGAQSWEYVIRDSNIDTVEFNMQYDDIKDTKINNFFYKSKIRAIDFSNCDDRTLNKLVDNGFRVPSDLKSVNFSPNIKEETIQKLLGNVRACYSAV